METAIPISTSYESLKYSTAGLFDVKSGVVSYTEPVQAINALYGIHEKTSDLIANITLERQSIIGSLLEKDEYKYIKNEFVVLSEKYNHVLRHYLENPIILDPYIGNLIVELVELISEETSLLLVEQYFGYIFSIYTTIRIKSFIRNFGQDVKDIKKVIKIIQTLTIDNQFKATTLDGDGVFSDIREDNRLTVLFGVVLILVSCISIPFNLQQIHPKFCEWVEQIITNIAENPVKYGICHDILPWLFSKYLHRADTSQAIRIKMIKWSIDSINLWVVQQQTKLQPQVFLLCLKTYFKNGDRAVDLDKVQYTFQNVNFEKLLNTKSIKIKTATYKLLQRVAIMMLKPPRMQPLILRKPHVKDLMGKKTEQSFELNQSLESAENNNDEIPIEIDSIIELLLSGLGSENFNSRWSCAKGIGNICERLDRLFVLDVIENIKSFINSYRSSECWQGACLAIGELARRCLITIDQLPEIVEKIKMALLYEERYATVSHGTFVRDAACYVCWTFARAFPPVQFNTYAENLMGDVLCVALFDTELICRRAASAVIQELVGRMKNIPHGIELVTTCDYNNVKSSDYCYKTLALKVSKLGSYQKAILNHLIDFRLGYWEINTRILASSVLADLAAEFPAIFINELLEQLFVNFLPLTKSNSVQIHGFLLAYSNIVAELRGKLDGTIFKSQFDQIIHKVRDIMRDCRATTKQLIQVSLLHFFAKMTTLDLDYPNLFTQDYYKMVFEDIHTSLISLHTPLNEKCIFFFQQIQRNRTPCSKLLLTSIDDYLVETFLPMVNTSKKRLRPLVEILLYLPEILTNKYFDQLYECYLKLFHMERKMINEDPDNIHAKAFSIKLFYMLFSNSTSTKITQSIWNDFLNLLIVATQNYTVNKQGDVGLYVRLMAIEHIPSTIELLSGPAFNVVINKKLLESLVEALLRQSAERVQKLRTAARIAFTELLLSYNPAVVKQCSIIDNYVEILAFLNGNSEHWCADSNAFIINYHMLQYPTYASSSLLGIFAFLTSPGCVDLENELVKNIFYHLETTTNCAITVKNIVDAIEFIVRNYSNHTRTRDSLIICLEPLISFKILKKATPDDREPLTDLLLKFLTQTAISTQVVGRIKQIIDSFISLIDITDSISKKHECLNQTCSLVAHPYPIVRVYAVEKLYVYFTVVCNDNGGETNKIEKLLSLLLDTQWEQDLDLIRPKVLEIHETLAAFN